MSITFFCPEAPTVEERPYEDEPDLIVRTSVDGEVNVSNSNGWALLQLVEQQPDYCGTWEGEQLLTMCERFKAVHNFSSTPDGWQPKLGPMISNGEYFRRVAERMVPLLENAIKRGGSVCWG